MSEASHPLDRPVWSALTGRQRALARGNDWAVRLRPEIGLFAAAAHERAESGHAVAALVAPGETIGLVELRPIDALPGLEALAAAACHQMVADAVAPPERDLPVMELSNADAPEMLALATLTRPGPFFTEPIASAVSSACAWRGGWWRWRERGCARAPSPK